MSATTRHPFDVKFSKRVKSLRVTAGLSPSQAVRSFNKMRARPRDISLDAWLSWERDGKTDRYSRVPTIDCWPTIAKVLGVTVRELLPEK